MTSVPTNIAEQLARDEGLRLHPYVDKVGKLTIGLGRNLTDVGISKDEALYLFENDQREVAGEVSTHIPFFSSLDDARQGVLLNMCFNMGITHLMQREKMLEAMAAEDWETAAHELLTFHDYEHQVGDRARRLAQQLITGQWQ